MQDVNSAANDNHTLPDTRGNAWGLGRLVYAAFWLLGAATVIMAFWELFSVPDAAIGPKLTTLFAGIVYLAAALGITHNGRRMRQLAWTSTSIALAGPIILGLFTLGGETAWPLWSPWTDFGRDVWYLSILLPLTGFVWLWWSNPKRIVEISEGLDRVTRRKSR